MDGNELPPELPPEEPVKIRPLMDGNLNRNREELIKQGVKIRPLMDGNHY